MKEAALRLLLRYGLRGLRRFYSLWEGLSVSDRMFMRVTYAYWAAWTIALAILFSFIYL